MGNYHMTFDGNFTDDTTYEEKLNHYHEQAWEEWDRRRLVEGLQNESTITNVNARDDHVDFYVGDRDAYPDYFDDDHLNVVGRSGLAFMQHGVQARDERRFVTEVNVHLPPAPDALKPEIESVLSMDDFDRLDVYWGTGALGGMPAPDGVVTPHVVHTDDVRCETVEDAIGRAIDAYVGVYDDGEKAIKERPEQ